VRPRHLETCWAVKLIKIVKIRVGWRQSASPYQAIAIDLTGIPANWAEEKSNLFLSY
jgi:hypothetical protein